MSQKVDKGHFNYAVKVATDALEAYAGSSNVDPNYLPRLFPEVVASVLETYQKYQQSN